MEYSADALQNDPRAYWCWDCGLWTKDCSHLVEPLPSPILKLNHAIYKEVTWHADVVQITTHFGVSRSRAVAFARNPDSDKFEGVRLERVRGPEG